MTRKTTKIGMWTALALTLGLAGSVQAEKRFDVSFGEGYSFLPSGSIDALTADRGLTRADLEAGMRVLKMPGVGQLEAGLSWELGGVQGTSFGRVSSDLFVSTMMLKGRVRRDVARGLSAFAELGMGVSSGTLRLDGGSSSFARALEDSDRAFASSLGGGMEYEFAHLSPDFSLGIRARLEYRAMQSLEFEATPMTSGEDELLLPTSSASLGSLDTSGAGLSVSLVGRF